MKKSHLKIILTLALGLGAGWLTSFCQPQCCSATDLAAVGPDTANGPTTNATPVLEINASKVTGQSSPTLYGLMTEEINYSYEGGLYGELIRNRTFKANATNALYWHTVGSGVISLDFDHPLNPALNVSLKLDVRQATQTAPAGFANGGYWGIPVRPKTTYHASFYAKSDGQFAGPLTVAIISTNNGTVFASTQVNQVTGEWQKYEVTLKTEDVPTSKDNQFVITASQPGIVWFSQVSLFPPTYHQRPNGTRPDLMQLLSDMHPQFLRFPGGNYLEGNEISNRFNWKTTIGDLSQRPGHMDDGWRYWSTDGLGLLEFLEWCEDLQMQPVMAVYAGYSMHQRHVTPGNDLQPYVQDALDEIEYVTGPTNGTWGALRARDGHPEPFALNYVEIGNEDFFDNTNSYDARFTQFYNAIKAKYPKLQCISTVGSTEPKAKRVHSVQPDLLDDHFYRSQQEMRAHAHDYDSYDRTGPKIFVGEWATRVGVPTPNLAGALGDGAWMTGMERNSDLVLISSYAPLFVNVSPGGMQWKTDLIGYDALNSYGSPAYYAQKMFSTHHGDQILATDSENIPTETWQPPARRNRSTGEQTLPPKQIIPCLFFDATRDSKDGLIHLKIVNTESNSLPVQIKIDGVKTVKSRGEIITLASASPDDTNSINDPQKVVPHTAQLEGVSQDFTPTVAPYSITILEISAQ
jgi:alpha-N-arabinofuranosidase